MSTSLMYETVFPASPQKVYELHTRPEALRRLSPSFPPVISIDQDGGFEEGTTVRIRIGIGPISLEWVARLEQVVPGRRFVDVQRSGPFRAWRHEHSFAPVPGGCAMRDEVSWKSRGPLGMLDRIMIRPMLRRYFATRHAALRAWIEEERNEPAAGQSWQEREAS